MADLADLLSINLATVQEQLVANLDRDHGPLGCSITDHLVDLSKSELKTKAKHWENSKALTRPRRAGDTHTWVIELDTSGITPSPVPDYILGLPTFSHPIFKHPIATVGEHFSEYYLRILELEEHMDAKMKMELRKLPEENRLGSYNPVFEGEITPAQVCEDGYAPSLKMLGWWPYYDDELARLLNKFGRSTRSMGKRSLQAIASRDGR
ncbi:hypothetical protein EJ02DRAFT_436867 [Clathrospora elynae]|uniref:Uncharacterized protein n=1 Tax=Clathrospora elynae TaxID=706981 RepID=A0A6A5SGN0_9PLEO|nr:hypothetical protein EJ02DRAFT_436867 [Clathrospora elynae]